jgi:hypothetical protein
MSEHQPKHEHATGHETAAESYHAPEAHQPKAERSSESKAPTVEDINKLRHEVSENAVESDNLKAEATTSELHTFSSHHILKKTAYKDLLSHTRRQLPKAMRTFSKVIHNSKVEAVSNVGAQTAARPSGLLGGGLGAFLGTVVLLYFSRHYGFAYNYSLFLIMFVGGFIGGLIIELIVKLLFHRQRAKI